MLNLLIAPVSAYAHASHFIPRHPLPPPHTHTHVGPSSRSGPGPQAPAARAGILRGECRGRVAGAKVHGQSGTGQGMRQPGASFEVSEPSPALAVGIVPAMLVSIFSPCPTPYHTAKFLYGVLLSVGTRIHITAPLCFLLLIGSQRGGTGVVHPRDRGLQRGAEPHPERHQGQLR